MFDGAATLSLEAIGPGEELRSAAKHNPSFRVEADLPTHAGIDPEPVGELLPDPLCLLNSMNFDQQELIAQIESCLSSLGIPFSLVEERNLPMFPDADEFMVIGNNSTGSPYYLIPEAGKAWFKLRDAAKSDRVTLTVASAYRSFQRQYEIVKSKIEKGIAPNVVFSVNAPPGYSEHHTGRALDLGTLNCIPLDKSFEKTSAFSWLQKNAKHYGFELSYPPSNTFGFEYEPWHWCYKRNIS